VSIYILGIESSCDDTSAAVIRDREILSNLIANQEVHQAYGGVVPELASRAHQQNIIPVVEQALDKAKISKKQLHAVAFTRGPGLLGSLLVGTSFAKSFALSLGIPVIGVDHMEAHILAHFIEEPGKTREAPGFPFLCLTVSGGHSQIVLVRDYFDFTIVGKTIDDAAGEAFDKAAKILGLAYPGGPLIDKLSLEGNELAFSFPEPAIPGLDYSFSGLKTSFLYFIRDRLKDDPQFIEKNKADLAASIQKVIIDILIKKLFKSSREFHVNDIAIAGGVSANSRLRRILHQKAPEMGWRVFIPKFEFCTDNAAMIAMTGYFKYLRQDFASQGLSAYARASGREN
jgi:N6-L-threonylcarbamoyladenine synthase